MIEKKIRNHERMQNEQVRTYALSKKIVQKLHFHSENANKNDSFGAKVRR